jgi:hypothetical protein
MRTLVVDGIEWKVKVGQSSMEARSDSQKIVVPLNVFNSWDNIERGRWKKTQDGMITPGEMAEAIRKTLGGDEDYFRPDRFPRVQLRRLR